jgi:hypothetical protein
LRNGGQLVFSNRLRAGPEQVAVGFTADQAAQFADIAAQLSADLPAAAALEPAAAHTMALAFAGHSRNYPLASPQSIADLATGAGLRIAQCSVVQSPPMRATVTGPTLGDGSRYVFVVLQHGDSAA